MWIRRGINANMAFRCRQCVQLMKRLCTINRHYAAINSGIEKQAVFSRNYSETVCTNGSVSDVFTSKASQFSGEKSELFENENVQSILKRLTGLNLDIVFKSRKENLKKPVYKVLNEDELKKVSKTRSPGLLFSAQRRKAFQSFSFHLCNQQLAAGVNYCKVTFNHLGFHGEKMFDIFPQVD